jgi:preprotein translocase subunit SecB
MSDSFSGAPIAPPAGSPDASQPPELLILAQYVRDLSFENPNAPASIAPPQNPADAQPNVQVNVDVGARQLGDINYEVTLTITAKAQRGADTLFMVELAYCGLFALANVPREHVQPLLLVECPRLIFPFARAIVADATRDGGFPPLMINPIDFAQMAMRNQAQAGGPTPMPGAAGTA